MGPKVFVFLDWDGTITKKNTVPLLADIAPATPSCPDYQWFLSEYMKDYEKHAASYRPSKAERALLKEEYAWLNSLETVERASIERVEAKGLFEGLIWTDDDQAVFEKHARDVVDRSKIVLRNGVGDLIDTATMKGACGIVSVNWSFHWMYQVLSMTYGERHNLNKLTISANEIAGDGSGRLSRLKRLENGNYMARWIENDGVQSHGIWTAGHKAMIMHGKMRQKDKSEWLSVYVGDSNTDLQCLMEADIGICIRDDELASEQESLAATLKRLNIACRSLEEFLKEDLCIADSSEKKSLWYAKDMTEISNALYG